MPKLSGTVSGSYNNFLNSISSQVVDAQNTTTSAAAGVTLTLPIFQGGRPSAQVRQAQARTSQAIETSVATERQAIAQTRGAYAAWTANQEQKSGGQGRGVLVRVTVGGCRLHKK